LIEMVSIFSSLHKSCKRLFIFLPLIIGLLINPISANALYPSDPSSVDVLKDDLTVPTFIILNMLNMIYLIKI
jgi:hypothetical protein